MSAAADTRLVDYRDASHLEEEPTRNGFGEGLVEAGRRDRAVVAVCADLAESTRMEGFRNEFPERFIEIGVQEQLLAAVSAGLALAGKIPFIASYAMFCPGRAWEQVRTNICLNEANVKIAGAHAGVSVGPDGATHQAIEDVAILRPIPNMTIVVPCDAPQTKKATLAVARSTGPAYVRFGRDKSPILTTDETPFELGCAQRFREGSDAAIVACGILVYNALMAAEQLSRESGIECLVLNNHTIKPMDEGAVIAAAQGCGTVVTVEEHEVLGGMGSCVAEILAQHEPVPIEFVGVHNRFGQSGTPKELLDEYGMAISAIVAAVKRAVTRKRTR
jgi:transketolase